MAGEIPERNTIIVDDETLRGGFTAMPNRVMSRDDISPGAKMVYLGLLYYAWQDGSCFPGQARLGMLIGIHEATVRKYLRELEEVGLVVTTRRGLNKTNLYRLPKLP